MFSAWAFPYVEDLGRCFHEVYRVLRPSGIFVFSSSHPFGAALSDGAPPLVVRFGYWDRVREWHWDDDPSKPRFRELSRPISETFQLLRDAGFVVDRILEPPPLEHERDSWDDSYPIERLKQVPATVIFRAVKPA